MLRSIDVSNISPTYLTEKSKIEDFDCGIKEINDFLLDGSALVYQEKYLAQTILLYYKNVFIGYFTLCCDAIYLDDDEIKTTIHEGGKDFRTFSAIKIARMGFNKVCRGQGCGTYVLDFVAGLVSRLNKNGIGCRFITVDAKPEAEGFYMKRGFKYNLHKYHKKRNKSLRLDVWQYKPLSK